MRRRPILLALCSIPLLPACSRVSAQGEWPGPSEPTSRLDVTDDRPLRLSSAEWQHRLTREQYRVLRQEGTERAFTSLLNEEHRAGVFHCSGCGAPLFRSQDKFDSGTGWPSFIRPLPGQVGETTDRSAGMTRTEIHCERCQGHLGHVFRDGPAPTHLRYCINGVSLEFSAS